MAPHRVHVKVDTGMHRMGVAPGDVDEVVDVLRASATIDVEGLYTHFSVADGAGGDDRAFTRAQIELFDEVVTRLRARGVAPRVLHAANSAGALAYPEARRSMSRVGLAALRLPAEPVDRGRDGRAGAHAAPGAEPARPGGRGPARRRGRASELRAATGPGRGVHHRHRALRLRRRLPAPAL